MDARILSGSMFVMLSAIFGGYGIVSLIGAYRTGDRTAWADKAVQGCLGVIAGGLFADLSTRFIS
jgi:hypothetical protein